MITADILFRLPPQFLHPAHEPGQYNTPTHPSQHTTDCLSSELSFKVRKAKKYSKDVQNVWRVWFICRELITASAQQRIDSLFCSVHASIKIQQHMKCLYPYKLIQGKMALLWKYKTTEVLKGLKTFSRRIFHREINVEMFYFYFQCWNQLRSLFSFFHLWKHMKRKVLKFFVFSWRRNLQNEIKENVFFWNGKKNLLNCFQTVKTSEKKNQKMNLVKIFSCMKPKENVFNPEYNFFLFTLFHTWV